MSSLDPHGRSQNLAQPPPPPLPPPPVRVVPTGKEQRTTTRSREQRIQRSLESMTTRHTREDVQLLVFRYLQQSGYLRSAMSFAYECMLSSGQQRRWWQNQARLPHSSKSINNNNITHSTDLRHHPFLNSGGDFAQLLQERLNNAENISDFIDKGKLLSMEQQLAESQGIAQNAAPAAAFNSRHTKNAAPLLNHPFPSADEETFPSSSSSSSSSTSLCTREHLTSPSRHQPHRGSSPFGTILLILVIYALIRLGSMK